MNRYLNLLLMVLIGFFMISCSHDDDTSTVALTIDDNLSSLLLATKVTPRVPPVVSNIAKFELGRALFFDKELSGNRDISCATCHFPTLATGDGLSLAIGQMGSGLGPARSTNGGLADIIARNAPVVSERADGLLNPLFADGRAVDNLDGTFSTPAGAALLPDLDNVLAAVDMFPVTDRAEMRGRLDDPLNDPGNELAPIDDNDFAGMWAALTARLMSIPEYVTMFQDAYPSLEVPGQVTFAHATNAIAEFQKTFTRFDSRFDDYLHGNLDALSAQEKEGALLFYGEANCASCHRGSLMTDNLFHNRVVPELGPGKGDGRDGLYDHGRERETGNLDDRFRFRTPPLRNVEVSGPWFHNGAVTTLEAVVRHELDPVASANAYDPNQLSDFFAPLYHPTHTADIIAATSNVAIPVTLTDLQVDALVAFLRSLTSKSIGNFADEVPLRVPSELPIGD